MLNYLKLDLAVIDTVKVYFRFLSQKAPLDRLKAPNAKTRKNLSPNLSKIFYRLMTIISQKSQKLYQGSAKNQQ